MGSGKSTVARAIVGGVNRGNVVSLATALKKMVAKHMSISPVLPYCLSNDFKQLPVNWPGPLAMDELPRPIAADALDHVNYEIREWVDHGGRPHPIATVGALLQFVGQVFRDVEPMYWVRALESSEEWRRAILLKSVGDACLDGSMYWVRAKPSDDWHEATSADKPDTVIDDVRYRNELTWFCEFMGATVVRVVARDETDALRGVAGRMTTHASETELDDYWFPITVVTDPKESDESLRSRVLQAAAFHRSGIGSTAPTSCSVIKRP
jgi:hypothetical protein